MAAGFQLEALKSIASTGRNGSNGIFDQTCALSLNIEPHGPFLENSGESFCLKDVGDFIQKRVAIIREAFFWQENGEAMKVQPVNICEWFEKVDLEVPAELMRNVGAHNHRKFQIKNAPNAAANLAKELGARERQSLLKIIIAMASDGNGYDPMQAKSPIPKQIQSTLALRGLGLDVATVRKFLKEASALLPAIEGDNDKTK